MVRSGKIGVERTEVGDLGYDPNDVVGVMKCLIDNAKAKFVESVDVAVNLGVDPRKSEEVVRGVVSLPHGNGRVIKIAVFASSDDRKAAIDAGADIVGLEELVAQVSKGDIDFDVCIATQSSMQHVSKVAKILGPKGLMPNIKTGTITSKVADTVTAIRNGQVQFRCDQHAIVHLKIGNINFDVQKLVDNLKSVVEAIIAAKPQNFKGVYIKTIYVSTTMSKRSFIVNQSVLI